MIYESSGLYGGKDIRIEDVPTPKIKDDEVLVRVKAVSSVVLMYMHIEGYQTENTTSRDGA